MIKHSKEFGVSSSPTDRDFPITIKLKCNGCGKILRCRHEFAGKSIKCLSCDVITQIPTIDFEDSTNPPISSSINTIDPRKGIEICWNISVGDSINRQASELGIIEYRQGTVARLVPNKSPDQPNLQIGGTLICHGCTSEIPFELEINWNECFGGCAVVCPSCGNFVDIGCASESLAEGKALFLYAAPATTQSKQEEHLPRLSVSVLNLINAQLASVPVGVESDNPVALLFHSVDSFNTYRDLHPEWIPDLTEMSICRRNLKGANLSNADLTEAVVDESDLSYANLQRATLHQTKIIDSNLIGVDLSQSILTETKFYGVDLREAIFEGVCLSDLIFTRSNLSGTNFAGRDLSSSHFTLANLTQANLENCNLRYSHLQSTKLRGANLRQADLRHATIGGTASMEDGKNVQTDFQNANFTGADLRESKGSNINLRGTNFTDARLPFWFFGEREKRDLIWDKTTQWPRKHQKTLATARVSTVAFSSDASFFLTAGRFPFLENSTIDRWDSSTHAHISTICKVRESVNSIALSTDGGLVAVSFHVSHGGCEIKENRLAIVDLTNNKRIAKSPALPPSFEPPIAFSICGNYLAYATDSVVTLFETQTLIPKFTFSKHSDSVRDLTFFSDGSRIVSISNPNNSTKKPNDNSIWIWDLRTGEPWKRLDAGNSEAWYDCVAVSTCCRLCIGSTGTGICQRLN